MADDVIKIIEEEDTLNEGNDAFAKLDRDRYDGGWANPFSLVGAMLKSQGALYRDLESGKWVGRYVLNLAMLTVLLALPYGAIMGLASSGMQVFHAALKLPIIILGSALLCLPTFYVFNALLGSRVTFFQTAAAVLFLTSGAGTILIAFAPIAWLFTVSTTEDGWRFLVLLHLVFVLTAAFFGIRFLKVGQHYLSVRRSKGMVFHGRFMSFWCILLLLVSFQMAYLFRPIMTEGPFLTGERGSFVTYVGEFFSSRGER